MISRRTALTLSEFYAKEFYSSYTAIAYRSKRRHRVDIEKLYDFLFSNNYPAWFCNLAEKTANNADSSLKATRTLKEFVMRLHTGESISNVTQEWSWQQREKLGQEFLVSMATDILNKWHTDLINESEHERIQIQKNIIELQKNLELDGYIYSNSRLLIPESDILDVKEEEGVLENFFKSLSLQNKETIFHHLSLSEEHYINSKWDDSISNSRKFLEGVLQEVAAKHSAIVKKIDLADSIYSKPVRVREYLEKEGLMEGKEVETLASIYGLLSETGGHPYMAQNDQARLLRHLSLTFAQFVMLRLQGNLGEIHSS